MSSSIKEFEESLLETAKSKKLEWFGSAGIPDALIESSFKSFIDLDSRTLVVKIDDGIGGKTDIVRGDQDQGSVDDQLCDLHTYPVWRTVHS